MEIQSALSHQDSDAFIILPSQYNDVVRRHSAVDGEHRLLLALVEDAIRCYLKRNRSYAEARAWLHSRDTSSVFAFRRVCDELEMDAKRLLKGIHSMSVRDLPVRRLAGFRGRRCLAA